MYDEEQSFWYEYRGYLIEITPELEAENPRSNEGVIGTIYSATDFDNPDGHKLSELYTDGKIDWEHIKKDHIFLTLSIDPSLNISVEENYQPEIIPQQSDLHHILNNDKSFFGIIAASKENLRNEEGLDLSLVHVREFVENQLYDEINDYNNYLKDDLNFYSVCKEDLAILYVNPNLLSEEEAIQMAKGKIDLLYKIIDIPDDINNLRGLLPPLVNFKNILPLFKSEGHYIQGDFDTAFLMGAVSCKTEMQLDDLAETKTRVSIEQQEFGEYRTICVSFKGPYVLLERDLPILDDQDELTLSWSGRHVRLVAKYNKRDKTGEFIVTNLSNKRQEVFSLWISRRFIEFMGNKGVMETSIPSYQLSRSFFTIQKGMSLLELENLIGVLSNLGKEDNLTIYTISIQDLNKEWIDMPLDLDCLDPHAEFGRSYFNSNDRLEKWFLFID